MDISRRNFLRHILAGSGFLLWAGYERLPGFKWSINDVAKFDGWKLEVDGLVRNPQRFSMADLRALSASKQPSIALSQILEVVKPLKRARYVVLHYIDRTLCIDMATAYTNTTMLVYDDIATHIQQIELSNKA